MGKEIKELRTTHLDDNQVIVDVWFTDDEHELATVVAVVDLLSTKVEWVQPEYQRNRQVNKEIKKLFYYSTLQDLKDEVQTGIRNTT